MPRALPEAAQALCRGAGAVRPGNAGVCGPV